MFRFRRHDVLVHKPLITSTDAAPGSGSPRIVMFPHDVGPEPGASVTILLDRERVTIGSAEGEDVRLAGLAPHHATIYHDAHDDYRLHADGSVTGGSASQSPDPVLSAGAHLVLGPWDLTYTRAEWADHGRPQGVPRR